MNDSRRDQLFMEFEKNIDLMCWITDVKLMMNRYGMKFHNKDLDRMFKVLMQRNELIDDMLEAEERWEDLGYVD